MTDAREVIRRCRVLAAYSEEAGNTTRTFLCEPMRSVHADVAAWMRGAGMVTRIDAAGNVRGVYAGAEPGDGNGAPRLYIGSHLDTVPRAGAFDGILGVVLGVALVESLHGHRFPFSIEVIGFSEEEGVRFGVPFIGSRALVGLLDDELLSRIDASGASVGDAIRRFGLDPGALAAARATEPAIGYVEFHIEQGPVLDRLGLAIGIVTAIAGQTRANVAFTGRSGHAGTTPMAARADAIACAAEWVLAVEREAKVTPGLVATVGRIDAGPGAANVIAGQCVTSLDVRHVDDAVRLEAIDRLQTAAHEIPMRRGLDVTWRTRLDQAAVAMDGPLVDALTRAVARSGAPVLQLPSGAGHDAMILAAHMPAAMLFVRSPGGISHHPDESVSEPDVAAALAAGREFLHELASMSGEARSSTSKGSDEPGRAKADLSDETGRAKADLSDEPERAKADLSDEARRAKSMFDGVVRGGTRVTSRGQAQADIAWADGRIVEIGRDLPAGREEIDARGLLVLPGVIDVHLHFNEPGRTEWEGAATGSRALAAGGGTLFFDMPLNSTPCTVNPHEFDRKRAALEAASVADFGLWGGLVPGAIPDMAEMAARGVVGFKAFMCDSGLPEFPRADDQTLFDGMTEAARLGAIVAVHAESESIVGRGPRSQGAEVGAGTEVGRGPRSGPGARDAAAFLASRPLAAELEAIEQALRLAGDTGARLHIVHVSSGSGVALAAEARLRGVDVSIETCPHYLAFTDADLERLGTVAKCAPPLRPAIEHERLWRELLAGRVDIVASDHSPTEPSRKRGDFVSAWGGIAGVQSTLAVLLDRALSPGGPEPEGRLTLERIVELIAETPARRFGVEGKGRLETGGDADLVLVDAAESFTLQEGDLLQRHPASPYVGRRFRGTVRRTIRRGETIFRDGRITARTKGRFVAASRTQP